MSDSEAKPPMGMHATSVSKVVFAALVVIGALLAAAWSLHRADSRAVEARLHELLAAHADMQARHLASWRMERFRDANSILASGPLLEVVRKCLRDTAAPAERESIHRWMSAFGERLRYQSVLLADPGGRLVLSAGQARLAGLRLESLARGALQQRTAVLTDLTASDDGDAPWMALTLPIEGGGAEPLGALVLLIDIKDYLRPLHRSRLPDGATLSTVLVRVERGIAMQFSPPLEPGGAIEVERFPVPRMERIEPGGLRRMRDHRGVDTVVAARRLPHSEWYVAAKTNYAEVLGAARWRTLSAGSAIGAAVACLTLTILYLVWRHNLALREQRAAAESQRRALEGHHGHLAQHVNDCVFLTDEQMRVVEANDRATETYGYSREEFLALSVKDLRDPSEWESIPADWERAGRLGSLRIETVHRRKDGTPFPVEVSTRVLEVDGRPLRQTIIRDLSAQKAMERRLQDALEELSAVIAASPAAIISVLPDGTVKSWNAAAERLFGWTAEETIGSPLPFVPEHKRGESRSILDRALGGETISGMELQRVAKDGRPLFLRLSAAALRGSRGVMAVLVDISREKEAEGVLRDSERRFRAAFEQAAVGMVHIGFDGRFIRANRRLAEIAAYPAEVMGCLRLPDLVFPADRETDAGEMRRLLAGEIETYSIEKRFVRSDAATMWVNLTLSLVRDERGAPLHLSAVVEDIDGRHRAQEASRESERRFRAVVENAPDGIYIHTGRTIRYANPAAVAAFGAGTEAGVAGLDMFTSVHRDYHDSVRERIRRLDAGGSVSAIEEVWNRLDGSAFEVEVSAIPHEHEGRPGALVFFRDITARKRAERERKGLEEQFHQLQRMESVGRLAGGVAHDFNNHLTVINGYCAMLLGRLPADHSSREIIEQILHAGERSADLVRQLLSFSRAQIVEPAPTDLNAAVAGVQKLLERLIGEDIRLSIDLAPEGGCVYMDPSQLNQILMNLAVNARDAMPRGGTLRIETAEVELDGAYAEAHLDATPGRYALLAVSDTGVGMAPEVSSRIFEPFFSTKADGSGTGLGLSTVYGIVRQAGGWIWVYSEPGKGSTFKVYLPRIDSPPGRAKQDDAVEETGLSGSETILVVEDQEELRRLAVEVLRKYGYTVLEAPDGPAAVNLCAGMETRLDLLVTDVIMPGMTGRALAEHLSEALPGLKVLYISGYTANVIADHGVLLPGTEYLAKPFTPGQLARKVRAILDTSRPAPAILVVDDQEGVRGLLRTILAGAGYAVLEAADGRLASRMARENPNLGLVITDLVMPEQEGLETIRMIKRDRPGLKVIAISGAFEGQFLRTAAFFGADATMAKPIDAGRLVECVRRLLPRGLHTPAPPCR